MNGTRLALGAIAALAGAAALRGRQRGSRMTLDEAYAHGQDAGASAAKYTDWDPARDYDPNEDHDLLESLIRYSYGAEDNARSFSPWEHLAAAINTDEAAEELWERYDEGVTAGIEAAARQRLGIALPKRRSIRAQRKALGQVMTDLGLPLVPPDDLDEWNLLLDAEGYDAADPEKWR